MKCRILLWEMQDRDAIIWAVRIMGREDHIIMKTEENVLQTEDLPVKAIEGRAVKDRIMALVALAARVMAILRIAALVQSLLVIMSAVRVAMADRRIDRAKIRVANPLVWMPRCRNRKRSAMTKRDA